MRTPKSRSAGLSLAECVISLGITSVLTLSLLSLFLSARTMGSKGEGLVTVTNMAEEELDLWKTTDFAVLEGLLSDPEVYQRDYLGQSYDIEVSAERLSTDDSTPEYKVLLLRVQVEWLERKQLTMGTVAQGSVNRTPTQMEVLTMVSAVGSI